MNKIQTKKVEVDQSVRIEELTKEEIIQIIKQVYSGIEVYFTAIGKKSYAHFTAYGVYIGKRKADLRIDTKKIAEILFGETKNGPRTVTPRNESGDSQPK